jgi:hypothetical protein
MDHVTVWYVWMQAGGFPEPELVHYNPKDFDFGKKKAFPFRDQVIYTVTLHTIPPSPYLDICRALFSIASKFYYAKRRFSSHQNIGTCMEY